MTIHLTAIGLIPGGSSTAHIYTQTAYTFCFLYMLMSGDQTAGRSHSMKTENISIERLEEFKYLGTNLKNQNYNQEEIKCR
jgi:hypothetical protein